jgi:hypothetical protein
MPPSETGGKMLKIQVLLIVTEIVLFVIMAFVAGRKYSMMPEGEKIIWRMILLVPIGLIIIPNTVSSGEFYRYLLLIGFCIVVIADIAIIYNGIAGLGLFLAFHVVNIVGFSSLWTGLPFFNWFLVVLVLILLFWLIVFLSVFKKEDIMKFFNDYNVPVFFRNSIVAMLIIFVYISSVLVSGWTGLALLLVPGIDILFPVFASLFAFIFAAGDFFIFIDLIKERNKPFHQILNNTLYYVPLILYAMLSVLKV